MGGEVSAAGGFRQGKGLGEGEGVRGRGQGKFHLPCHTTWCFALKGLRTGFGHAHVGLKIQNFLWPLLGRQVPWIHPAPVERSGLCTVHVEN